MHITELETWQHKHNFEITHKKSEQRTTQVLIMTAVTMVVEIVAGMLFGSMALLADGWHMGTHVAAFVITVFAYKYARKHQANPQFAFGTGKVSVLGGFTSAVILLVVALVMAVESLERVFNPRDIHFNEAIWVALLGLFINVVCALLLKDEHGHDHQHEHVHHHDHNLKAAYFHVLADALTSFLAIIALVAGKFFGWNWLDPVMGIVGALVITRWSFNLLKESAPVLMDKDIENSKKEAIKVKVESDSDNRVSDLHLWKVGPNSYAVIISLVTHFPKPVEYYKNLLQDIHKLSHITIEVNKCMSEPCIIPRSTMMTS
ncbi:MAG: CDF family Co(II)/Ni(II) efflux transporter DmeF [Desulfamplus sp.]|nr:CDF family Co(II)/Ni(II) efflux transporter DmeF [Desulfamplus sp.]